MDSITQPAPASLVAAFKDFLLKRRITDRTYRAVREGDIPVNSWDELRPFLLDTGMGHRDFAKAERLWKKLQRQQDEGSLAVDAPQATRSKARGGKKSPPMRRAKVRRYWKCN